MKKLFFATFVALSATAVIAFSSCKEHCEVDGIAVFELSQSEFQVANSGEIVSVKVASKVNWTAETAEDWIKLKAEDIESVDGREADDDFASSIDKPFNFDRAGGYVTVEIEIAENPAAAERNGEIIFTTSDMQTFTVSVTQMAGGAEDDNNNGSGNDNNDDFPEDMELMFPDPIFRAYVMDMFDTDKDGRISKEEAEKVTYINVNGYAAVKGYAEEIASLEGVQYFTNLTRLVCDNNKLTELDLTHNTALTELSCSYNQLTTLNVIGCSALYYLWCENNQLETLNVSGCPALTVLVCYSNKLTELDVTQNSALEYLSCYTNQLTKLDVTQNTALGELRCSSNQLTTLDVTQNPALEALGCSSNQLTELDVTQNTALEILQCYSNQLTTLDVSKTNLGGPWLGNYDSLVPWGIMPLDCSPMNGSGLKTLYLKEGWTIKNIYPKRDEGFVPKNTQILFKD